MTNMLTIAGGVLIGGSVLALLGVGLLYMIRKTEDLQGSFAFVSFMIGLWAAAWVILKGLS